MVQYVFQKGFSRNSRNEVHTVTRKGRGFADIKIMGEKGLTQLFTHNIHVWAKYEIGWGKCLNELSN